MSSTSEHFTARLPTKRVAADCLIFNGVVVSVSTTELILQADEIRSARFVSLIEAKPLMTGWEYARLELAVRAGQRQSAIYLEDGRPIEAAAQLTGDQ